MSVYGQWQHSKTLLMCAKAPESSLKLPGCQIPPAPQLPVADSISANL